MKTFLVVWLILGVPPETTSTYEFETQNQCFDAVVRLEADNKNVGAMCLTESEWKELNK